MSKKGLRACTEKPQQAEASAMVETTSFYLAVAAAQAGTGNFLCTDFFGFGIMAASIARSPTPHSSMSASWDSRVMDLETA